MRLTDSDSRRATSPGDMSFIIVFTRQSVCLIVEELHPTTVNSHALVLCYPFKVHIPKRRSKALRVNTETRRRPPSDTRDRADTDWRPATTVLAKWCEERLKERTVVLGRIEGGWAYEMTLDQQNGRPVVAELRVFPDSDDLRLNELSDMTKASMAIEEPYWADRLARELAHAARTRQQGPVLTPARGLTARHLRAIPFGGHSPLHYLKSFFAVGEGAFKRTVRSAGDSKLALIARLYVQAQERGSRRQNAEVAQALGMRSSQVRDAIHRARRQGLLTATRKQGASGGELTPKAVVLLRQAEEDEASEQAAKRPSAPSRRPPRSDAESEVSKVGARLQPKAAKRRSRAKK